MLGKRIQEVERAIADYEAKLKAARISERSQVVLETKECEETA